MLLKYVHTKFEGCLNSYEIGNLICVIILHCQMGLSDGAFFMIKHTPLPNGNHTILSPICQMGVENTLGPDNYFSPNMRTIGHRHHHVPSKVSGSQICRGLMTNWTTFLGCPVALPYGEVRLKMDSVLRFYIQKKCIFPSLVSQ